MDEYHIYKFITSWQYVTSTSNTYYEDTDEDYCTAPPPQQCTNEHNISYRITAEDLGSNESDYSNTVVARVLGGPPAKLGGGNSGSSAVVEYSLKQNYPNPFNPTTTIDYSIKSAGIVTLKVYDMLGKVVASLVNERKESGNYSVTFKATNLPSGIYIYKLTAGKFTETKKLLLLR
ncbi:MAG: T9SS type A sorting domain-containing protein [Ignavibacteria bacterium]|nr:T9SS type A sorting domain-containing protein [Ignavibacteria bacterium]MBT8381448.1 T9SS type A sorting domain-containing protein [Ignavibacteria bacterium]MBT8390872.1 T9SS type A sorting domain-containing protein [Ignavibacteria bacterium]NNJ53272.1 T9SS type A sorting domain-containing protein [Ignavibacteriaceae bacterium]NNL21954.1 T9SS type A sorting domain-containing protein [Ignavibacteriaceae bacterium]